MEPGETAFTDLYNRTYGAIEAYARRRTTPGLADDIVTETFLVALRRPGAVPAGRELVWLYGVAHRLLANQRRAQRREHALVDRLERHSVAVSADPADTVGERAAALSALSQLSPNDQEALRLVAWEGLDTAAAAEVAGCTRAAMGVRLHRARRRLVHLLTDPSRPDTPHPATTHPATSGPPAVETTP